MSRRCLVTKEVEVTRGRFDFDLDAFDAPGSRDLAFGQLVSMMGDGGWVGRFDR